MGIKYFFSWFKKTFSNHIRTKHISQPLDVSIDTFLIDLNGIFHYCAQKAFHYGNFAKKDVGKTYPFKRQQLYMFEQTGDYIHQLIHFVRPQKRVVLCIDGVAPVSKQFQQRQRRFRSSLEQNTFDSNCITPGTQFMDFLSSYLEWFIHMKMMSDPVWQSIEVVFSNEKVPGEGEHKLVKLVRDYGSDHEQFMIHGMDADLIMLALASQRPNFHVLRENPYRQKEEFFYINMKGVRDTLVLTLLHEPSMLPDQFFINDFILMMFMSGNDFLPNLPTIDILEGSIEKFFETYRNTVSHYGNIVTHLNTINTKPLAVLLGTIGSTEILVLEERRKNIRDSLLEKHCSLVNNDFVIDWPSYRKEYYEKKLNCVTEIDIEKVCLSYLQGMQWVLTYYTEGVPCWRWFYPYRYAPFSSDLVKYCEKLVTIHKVVSEAKPFDPFMQLLCVLPTKSCTLLPDPLPSIMTNAATIVYYPLEFEIDLDGKRNEWEGTVLLPLLDIKLIDKYYRNLLSSVSYRDKRRNQRLKTVSYQYGRDIKPFQSYYGAIPESTITSEYKYEI